METIKHLLGLCGEHWHPNIFTISLLIIIIKLVYEKYISKNIWISRR
jgi:hypothetical protein